MFSFSKAMKSKESEICAVVKGKIKSLEKVEDPIFSNGTVGQGVAIEPSDSIITAPCDGTLSVVFPTGHAFGLIDEKGIEYLIHIGVDTVSLKGEGFQLLVEQGQKVKKGDELVKVDFDFIKKNNLHTDTMILVTTPKDSIKFNIVCHEGDSVSIGDTLFKCKMK